MNVITPEDEVRLQGWIRVWTHCAIGRRLSSDRDERESAAGLAIAEWIAAHGRAPTEGPERVEVLNRHREILRSELRTRTGTHRNTHRTDEISSLRNAPPVDPMLLEELAASEDSDPSLRVLARALSERVRTLAHDQALALLRATQESYGEDAVAELADVVLTASDTEVGTVLADLAHAEDADQNLGSRPSPVMAKASHGRGGAPRMERSRRRRREVDTLHRAVLDRRSLAEP